MKTLCAKCKAEIEIDMPQGVTPEMRATLERLALNVTCDVCSAIEEKKAELKRKEEGRRIFIERSKLPEHMIQWDKSKGNAELAKWVNLNAESSLYIPDTYGTCKTRAVCAVAYHTRKIHPFMRFYTVSGLIAEIMGYYAEGLREVNEFKESIYCLDLLILDDFGKEKLTDRAGELMFDVIDNAYVNRRKIWITTNQVNQETIIEHLGADRGLAIIRRISEMCKQWGQS